MNRTLGLSLAVVLALAGCSGPRAVRGGAGTENPNLDRAAMSTGLDREDLNWLLQQNLEKLHASRAWADFRSDRQQPIVAIWPIKNDTSEHIESELNTLLSTIETDLVESGVVAVVSRERQREMAEEVGLQQTQMYDPAMAARISKQVGAKYFVTGKVQAVDERAEGERRVQYTLTIQLIDVETSLIKFQNTTARTKAIVR
jgi:uncharacterized protein (TIGR02722 family)